MLIDELFEKQTIQNELQKKPLFYGIIYTQTALFKPPYLRKLRCSIANQKKDRKSVQFI